MALIQNIAVTSGELNTGVDVAKDITDRTLYRTNVIVADGSTEEVVIKRYKPTSIKVTNGTGVAIGFLPLTAEEYIGYTTRVGYSGAWSDQLSVANGATETMTNFNGEITKIVVKGSTGHTTGLTFVVIQD